MASDDVNHKGFEDMAPLKGEKARLALNALSHARDWGRELGLGFSGTTISAPDSAQTFAMPHAIDLSLATPRTKPHFFFIVI